MVEIQSVWNWTIAVYLFLGGLSAGVFCTTAILRLFGKGGYKSTLTYGSWFATIALGLGLVFLLIDVGMPFRALLLWQSFSNFSSWMAIGAWLLFIGFIIFLIVALLSTGKIGKASEGSSSSARGTIAKVLSVIGIFVALGIAIYTGILLRAAQHIPVWDTWLLPALFTVSALDTGVAAVAIFLCWHEKDPKAHRMHVVLERIIIVLVVVEVAVIAYYFSTVYGGGGVGAQTSIAMITAGQLSTAFWVLVVAVGLTIPFLVAVVQQFSARKKNAEVPKLFKVLPSIGVICALVGGFTLRYVILASGIHEAFVSPATDQAIQGILFFFN